MANGLVIGSLDAAVLWNFSATLYLVKLELISTALNYPEVRVTVVGLTKSLQPVRRDEFLEWFSRPAARELFKKYGYVRRNRA